MKLLLTGLVSPLLVILLFLIAATLTVVLYRKHALSKPWNLILPALRITSLFLLLLTLLQPVLAKYGSKRIIGQIPVIIDTSGSMQTVDEYEKHRKIELCWSLKFFEQPLRYTGFDENQDTWNALGTTLLALEDQAAALKDNLQDPEAIKAFAKAVQKTAGQVDQQRKRLTDEINQHDYLTAEKKKVTGEIAWQRFNDIQGATVQDLTKAAKFPDKPDEQGVYPRFESNRNIGDYYGLRIYGYLVPPADGRYEFFKESDDGSEVWMSKDDDPANLRRLIDSNNTRGTQSLKKDQACFIQVLFKEGYGDDYFKLGWKRPDGNQENPIPGHVLATHNPDAGSDFQPERESFFASLHDLHTSLFAISEALQPEKKEDKEKPLPVADQLTRFGNSMEVWRSIEEQPGELQRLSDETLHDAQLPEVDAAVERLDKMTRLELAKLALDSKPFELLKKLGKKGEVAIYGLDEAAEELESEAYANLEAPHASTRMGSTISRIMTLYEKLPVAGVVLLSDGLNNAGIPVREMREALDERNIALYPLAIGAEKPPPDVAIARVNAPRTTFKDDTINLAVSLHRHGHTDKTIKLQLMSGEELLKEEEVPPGDEEELVVDFSYAETNSGTRVYNVKVDTYEDEEAFDHNNEKAFTVNILEDRILTLCLDEFPRWETRYANMMLKRDKRVDLDTIFVASTQNRQLPVGAEKDGYPDSKEALFKYHIMVLGDVNPNHFSTKQLEDIRDFVVERGGTLIAMAGPHYMPAAYSGTPLADVLPLDRMGERGGTNHVAIAFDGEDLAFKEGLYQPVLSQEGAFEEVLQVGNDPEKTFELWNRLPRLSWLKEDVTTARSADLLVDAEAHKGESITGQAPVMAKSYAGLGKVLYLGSDSFWRWRYRARWKYHHRFWGQILLWSTTGRTTGSDKHVKLMADRPIYAPEEPVVIKARLLDEKEMPLLNADASIEIYDDEDQLVKRQPLFHIENSGGEYRAEVRDLERGAYRIEPRVQELDHLEMEAEVRVDVRDLPTSEFIDLGLNMQGLQEISTNAVPFETALNTLDRIEKIDLTEETRSDLELWDTWWYLAIIAMLLSLEWMLRKRCKLA